jgi:site-specific recombinase XerD
MPPVEPIHFRRAASRPRMKAPVELPPESRDFLRTARGRRARSVVHSFHRWLDRHHLTLAELMPDHLRRFLARPQRTRVTPRTSGAYWDLLRDYLQRLCDRGLIKFDPERLRRHPKRLPAIAREYLASLAPTHRPSTCHGFATALRKFYGWLDQHKLEAQRLTRQEIAPWFQELHAAGLQPASRRHLLVDVRAYLRWLSERQRMRTAPDDLIRTADLPKLPLYLPRPLTMDADRELQRRLAASEDPCAWALLLMRRTGLRIGELRGLEYHCLRPDERRPLLKVPLGKMNNERLVPLAADTVDLIRRLQSTAPRARPWLVPGPDGRQISFHRLIAVLNAHSNDLPDPVRITSHRLRHTYATEMLSAGMSLLGVMRLLGHRDYRMTLRYTAITPDTVGDEYHKALAQLATKYRLPPPAPPDQAPDPDQLLEHLARWLRKHAPSRQPLRPLLKRIERLQHDVRSLKTSTKK